MSVKSRQFQIKCEGTVRGIKSRWECNIHHGICPSQVQCVCVAAGLQCPPPNNNSPRRGGSRFVCYTRYRDPGTMCHSDTDARDSFRRLWLWRNLPEVASGNVISHKGVCKKGQEKRENNCLKSVEIRTISVSQEAAEGRTAHNNGQNDANGMTSNT